MATEIRDNGEVIAPLNITLPAPTFNLRGFNWGTVDEKLRGPIGAVSQRLATDQVPLTAQSISAFEAPVAATPPVTLSSTLVDQLHLDRPAPKPPGYPLAQLQGVYSGNGFNMIFRPRSRKEPLIPITQEDPVPGKAAPVPLTASGPDDNVLELNLTTEQLNFGGTIGGIPNRGNVDQEMIKLTGIPYLQTVQDRTNPSNGLGDSAIVTDIHFEPGMLLLVPGAKFQNGVDSVVRMASIPHGTTIHAQGFVPKFNPSTVLGGVPGGPKINDVDTTPFTFGNPDDRQNGVFPSMDATNQKTFRLPQDLTAFNEKSKATTITTAFIKNPNLVLKKAIEGLKITETITLELFAGGPDATLNGGGTANIAFLAGKQTPITNSIPTVKDNPIAHVDAMKVKYWIERVAYQVNVPATRVQATMLLKPTMPPGSRAPTPQFAITTPAAGVPQAVTIEVPGIQVQVSQSVNINFAGPAPLPMLTWPHISVSTLIPAAIQTFQMK